MQPLFIIGLGNVGKEYEMTRHNAGFRALDLFASKNEFLWRKEKQLHAWVADLKSTRLIKPTTMMNESGRAVVSSMQFWMGSAAFRAQQQAMSFPQLILVYDDLDMELGQWKRQFGKHPKIHNGVNSVMQELGTDQFWNVRVGVDTRKGDRSIPADKYVLTTFTQEQERVLADVFQNVVQDLHDSPFSA